MGWQLFPLGVGWREFASTPGRGEFTCPNPRCKSAGTSTPYLHKAGRNWFTVLFIPVIPMNKTGEWIRCARCKSVYLTTPVASPPPPPPVPPPAPAHRTSAVPTIRFTDGSEIELVEPVVIGRDPAPVADHPTASIHRVPDPTVSKTHLVVGRTGDEVWALDLHSSNGVFVGTSPTGGDRIAVGRRVVLVSGSVVSVGDATSFTVGGQPW
jgi:hypothetical protein